MMTDRKYVYLEKTDYIAEVGYDRYSRSVDFRSVDFGYIKQMLQRMGLWSPEVAVPFYALLTELQQNDNMEIR